jgi:hypothetical protein
MYIYYSDKSYHLLYHDLSLKSAFRFEWNYRIKYVGMKGLYRKLFLLNLKLYSSVCDD